MGQDPTSTLVFGVPIVEDEDYNLPVFMQDPEFYMDDHIAEETGITWKTHTREEVDQSKLDYPVGMSMHSTYDDPDHVLTVPGTETTATWGGEHIFEDGLPSDPSPEKIAAFNEWASAHGVTGEPRWMLLAFFG